MAKKTTKNTAKDTEAEISKAVKIIHAQCEPSIVLGEIRGSNGAGVVSFSAGNAKTVDDTIKKFGDLTDLLVFGLVSMVTPASDTEEITQGKVDLAYEMAVQVLHKIIALGAEDIYGLHDDIPDEFDNIDENDIKGALYDDTPLFDDDDEEEIELYAPKNEKEFEEMMEKVFGIDVNETEECGCPKDPKKGACDKCYGKKCQREEHEIRCFKKKLSPEQMKKLSAVLDEIEGEE